MFFSPTTWYVIFFPILGIEAELKFLHPSFFDAEVNYYGKKCYPGTRIWLINNITDWVLQSFNNTSRVYLITANAGMGKSVIAGKLCHHFSELGIFAGCFFFQHNKVHRNNPVSVIHTLAFFLNNNVPSFRSEFGKHISNLNSKMLSSCTAAELFTYLILEPIGKLNLSDVKVFVIDALDECDLSCHSEMIKLILREFAKLPSWISIIITSRADETIRKLKQIRPKIHLDPQDPHNINDITCFLRGILTDKIDPSSLDDGISLLVKKSEGLFLYFHYSVQVLLERKSLTIPLLKELLPEGIDDYFNQNFSRLHTQLQHYYHPLLSMIVAARSGIPIEIISYTLNCSSKTCSELIRALSIIFPVSNNSIQLFHTSIRDWITDPEEAEEHVVSIEIGHQILAKYIKSKLESLMNSCPSENDIQSNPLTQFIMKNAIYHGSAIQEYSVDVCQWLTDIQFLYYHILVSHGVTALLQDFDLVKRSLHSSNQSMNECEMFLRKHVEVLDNPLLLFQLALNESDAFQRKINMEKVKRNPKSIFHQLKCILTLNKSSSSPALVTSISQPLPVNSCRVSQNGTVVTVCGEFTKGILCMWKWKCEIDNLAQFDLKREVNCCDISSDQRLIACGGVANIYDFTGAKVDIIGSSSQKIPSRDCSLFSPKMDTLLCWDSRTLPYFTNIIELWNIKHHSKVIQLDATKDQGKRALCACYSPDGNIAITGHADGSLKVWECQTGELLQDSFLPDLYNQETSIKPNASNKVQFETEDLSSAGLTFTVTFDPRNVTADDFKIIMDSSSKTPEKIGKSVSELQKQNIFTCLSLANS